MADLASRQGSGHVWCVGAYARYSMPLLENGVKSAMEVARALGVDTSDIEVDETRLAAAAAAAAGRQRLLAYVLLIATLLALTIFHAQWAL